MDLIKSSQNLQSFLRKYRVVWIVILAGIFLMSIPAPKEPKDPAAPACREPDFQEDLENILTAVQGAGRVELLLSTETGEMTVFENNEKAEKMDGRMQKETVILKGSDREEQGLIRQIIAPTYRGAVVIAQGADSPKVRLDLVKAVSSATGLGANKITVLKMK